MKSHRSSWLGHTKKSSYSSRSSIGTTIVCNRRVRRLTSTLRKIFHVATLRVSVYSRPDVRRMTFYRKSFDFVIRQLSKLTTAQLPHTPSSVISSKRAAGNCFFYPVKMTISNLRAFSKLEVIPCFVIGLSPHMEVRTNLQHWSGPAVRTFLINVESVPLMKKDSISFLCSVSYRRNPWIFSLGLRNIVNSIRQTFFWDAWEEICT